MNKALVIASLATCLVTGHVLTAESGHYGSSAKTNAASARDSSKVAKNGK